VAFPNDGVKFQPGNPGKPRGAAPISKRRARKLATAAIIAEARGNLRAAQLLEAAPSPDPPPPSAALALPTGHAMPSHLPPPFGSAAEIAARRCFLCGVANPCHSWGPPLVPPGRIVWGCAACRADIEGPLTAGRWPTPRPRR
jgi:hypothetical protein